MKAPLYGADTPQSFFDAEVAWGWNLRKLQCLISQNCIPKIPGVNTPMTYFGMWKVRNGRISESPASNMLSRGSHRHFIETLDTNSHQVF